MVVVSYSTTVVVESGAAGVVCLGTVEVDVPVTVETVV
jgi:hypothetical protein